MSFNSSNYKLSTRRVKSLPNLGPILRDVGVAGSNPVTPTSKSKAYAANSGPLDRIGHSGTHGGLRSPDELSDLQSRTARGIGHGTKALCRRCCAPPLAYAGIRHRTADHRHLQRRLAFDVLRARFLLLPCRNEIPSEEISPFDQLVRHPPSFLPDIWIRVLEKHL